MRHRMINQEKYYAAIKGMTLNDEGAVKKALEGAGLYSKSQIFPLASLQFELTSHCNADCKHCYNSSGSNNNEPDAMTPDRWISFAKYLVKHGGVFECVISGGEPLLIGNALFDLMDVLHADGTIFLLQTNGILLSDEIARKLKKYHYHWVQISIDGTTEQYHDSFRQRTGCWAKATRAALSVSEQGIPLKIAHCITPYNLQDIDDMCDFAYSLGASAITVGELCLSGRSSKNRDLLLSQEQRLLLHQKVDENFSRYRGRMIVKSSNSVRSGLERKRKSPASSALIRPNGDIRIDGMAPFVIGNILTEDFAKVWENKIKTCWEHPKVREFISGFNDDDRNLSFVNFIDKDIRI